MQNSLRKYLLFHGFVFALLISIPGLNAQVPFNTSPSWISTANNAYSTGAAWADINRDGWLDLVIADGNDMSRQRLVVYYNNNGSLPVNQSWQSSDIDYHAHLSIGDVNLDGFPDVAVSVYIGAVGFSQKGKVKLYLNNNGTLSSSPSWISQDSMYTFSCAFGDADNDGDVDLAVACGEGYYSHPDRNRIYFNINGTLNPLPGWFSSDISYGMDVGWGDFNHDNRLDLIFANEKNHPNRLYLNYGDSIGTIAVWSSTDASKYANSLFISDVNNDGFLDFAVSDNNQLGGNGKFKIYMNNAGTLSTTPFWQSSFSGYGSGINLADIDFDNDNDLVTGAWWNHCWIYLNQSGTFSTTPQWTSSTNSVVEAIVFGDYNNNGLDTITTQFTGNGIRKLFYNTRKPVHKILIIRVGNDTLLPNQFCYDLENGWFSLKNTPPNGAAINIRTIVSHSLDFAVSNWDANIGNYVFYNTYVVGNISKLGEIPKEFVLYQNFPNPFNPVTRIKFDVPSSVTVGMNQQKSIVKLIIFDILGREVATIVDSELKPGGYEVTWNASDFPSGIYFCRISSDHFSQIKKMILLK
jgi:hypothetical protein